MEEKNVGNRNLRQTVRLFYLFSDETAGSGYPRVNRIIFDLTGVIGYSRVICVVDAGRDSIDKSKMRV